MTRRIVVLGAGFGGLELASSLSDALGPDAGVTLIDKADSFMFGYSKLDVLFGRASREALSLPYGVIAKPGVRLVQEAITAIDPESRRVTTGRGEYEADYLVVALGADYAYDATPGLTEADAFYSLVGAERLAGVVPSFVSVHAVIGVCGTPYKCTPAPSECALLLHDDLVRRGVRDDCEISYIAPQPSPIPPSPDAARVVLEAFAERDINFVPGRRIASLDRDRSVAGLDDGTEVSYHLFLGVPKHRAPDVVLASGLAVDDYVPVDKATLATRYPQGLRRGRLRYRRGAEGWCVRRGRRGRRRGTLDRRGARRPAAGAVSRHRELLRRVRRRPCQPGEHRCQQRTATKRDLRRTVRGARRREA
ncbi:MAG: NAD(P)/FAD-dependent oxidoreductase [Solirubrobacteraceae bacterium]